MSRRVVGVLATERGARAAWSRVAEPGDPRVSQAVAMLGAVEALAVTLDGADPAAEVFRRRTAGVDLAEMIGYAERRGMRVLIPGDTDWPVGLDDLACPPVCLWVAGPAGVERVRETGVAVVGARACTAYGIGVACELAAGLADHGYAVVSGAAYGIDRAAHEGALGVGGVTVAVLAGGLDRIYPPEHRGLLGRIGAEGVLVSEVAPGGAPTRSRFLTRNRLIATMTAGTLVVEAGVRSGSLSTARAAAEHARPVAVVPGPVTSRVSAGCHEAVRQGYATLVTDVGEALDLFGRLGDDAAPMRRGPVQPADHLPAEDRQVLAVLPIRASATVQALADHAGLEETSVRASLGRLELVGVAVRSGARWRQVARPRGA